MSCRELTGARVLFPLELLVCLYKRSTCRSLLVWFDCVVKPSVLTLLCPSHQSFWYALWFVRMPAVKQNACCMLKSGLFYSTFKLITSEGLTACVITINLLDVIEWLISVCILCTKAKWRRQSATSPVKRLTADQFSQALFGIYLKVPYDAKFTSPSSSFACSALQEVCAPTQF